MHNPLFRRKFTHGGHSLIVITIKENAPRSDLFRRFTIEDLFAGDLNEQPTHLLCNLRQT